MSTPTPTLDFTNIQGDILEGLVKKFETFVFFAITDATHFRQRLKAIIPLITTTTQALANSKAIADHKANGNSDLIKLVGTNIAFSQTGLTALGIKDNLGDSLFRKGQLADASDGVNGLGDPGVVNGSTVDPAWEPAFKEKGLPHGCILITGESQATISERLQEIETKLAGTVKTITQVDGNVRPGTEAGHEHFGFQDCLSQPPVIGFRKPNTGEQPINPGEILIGELGDEPDTGVTRPTWAKDSSFLVFRKLRQFVPEFNEFLAKNPILDKGLTPAQGSELLGARLMGRWKSGAPIDRDPTTDNLADAKDVNKVNDFDYSDDVSAQVRCPFTAHLRKTNPRASAHPGLPKVQINRRIIRQGIPYGPEVDSEEAQTHTSKHDRGLLFVCYQSNISNGFGFIQKSWANNPNFPTAGLGFDAIIGLNINNPRVTTGMDPQNVTASLALPQQLFVAPRGGEYFLSPSISALKTMFSA